MAIRVPDLLAREIRHCMERFQDRARQLGLRRWLNESPRLVLGMTLLSTLVLTLVLVRALRPASTHAFQQGKTAWFYDANTGKLFAAGRKQTGPIAAPSGPTLKGEPSGFRAHVYSYVLDPNEADLFVGFLEQPDPFATTGRLTSDMMDMDKWAQGRLIRRAKDKQWVQVTSPEGQTILQELTQPDKKGRTPIYQMPR
jgi:hypothetical protein